MDSLWSLAVFGMLSVIIYQQVIIKKKSKKIISLNKWHTLAFTDDLTGLQNHTAYSRKINVLQSKKISGWSLVLFDIDNKELNVVALDGYRLARVKKNITSSIKRSIVIPSRSLNEINKLIDDNDEIINIYIDSYTIMLDLGDTKITSRLLEGDYINYKQIIPVNFETFAILNKDQFEDALDRATLLSKTSQNNFVKFDIKENNICITSNSELGNIKENVPATVTGKDLVISFNPRYFIESLRANANEFVKVCLSKSSTPCVIVPTEEDEFLYLILPVRVIG